MKNCSRYEISVIIVIKRELSNLLVAQESNTFDLMNTKGWGFTRAIHREEPSIAVTAIGRTALQIVKSFLKAY